MRSTDYREFDPNRGNSYATCRSRASLVLLRACHATATSAIAMTCHARFRMHYQHACSDNSLDGKSSPKIVSNHRVCLATAWLKPLDREFERPAIVNPDVQRAALLREVL